MLLSILIVKIYPSKETEKYIVEDEAVQSNIKLLVLMSLSVLSAQRQGKEQTGVRQRLHYDKFEKNIFENIYSVHRITVFTLIRFIC